ncbi:dehalogenase [Dehalococcoides mccartyi]|uniref:dehalogenase n=1 Tax=Dehalococcoides mccartyi TaxID=61435 RepID=UPI000909A4C2|nr:dehalogenase [Dehalococcoides mccartyi]APH13078.1 dehalogenase [Dehalococcoides mccartyi]
MWFLIGLILGVSFLGLMMGLRTRKISLSWYEWVIGVLGLGLLLFTIQNYFGSLAEVEPKAAYMFLLVTGLPSIIVLAVTWQLAARRAKKA